MQVGIATALLVVAVLLALVDELGFHRTRSSLRWLRSWLWFPAGLSVGELRAMRAFSDPTGPVKAFYEWRQDQWRKLAGGSVALIVTLFVTLLASSTEDGRTVTKTTEPAGAVERTSTSHGDVPVTLLILIAAVGIVAILSWTHAFALQRRMTRDLEAMPT